MKPRAYEWDPRPPTFGERLVCGIWLAAFAIALANNYAGWRLFWGYDDWVVGGFLIGGLILLARLPGVRRVEGVDRPQAYWLVFCAGAVAAIVLTILNFRG